MRWIEALHRSSGNGGELPLNLSPFSTGRGRRVAPGEGRGTLLDLAAAFADKCPSPQPSKSELRSSRPREQRAEGGGSLRQMRGQRMIGRLAEERGFLGGGFQELPVLVIDVVAELDGLVLGHPRRQID